MISRNVDARPIESTPTVRVRVVSFVFWEAKSDRPVHVLPPSSDFLDLCATFLVAFDVLPLRNISRRCCVHAEKTQTLVEPKPAIPIVAIMASSS